MKFQWILLSSVIAILCASAGVFAAPATFSNRIPPGMQLDTVNIAGMAFEDLEAVLASYETQLQERTVVVQTEDKEHEYTLKKLGVSIDIQDTQKRIQDASGMFTYIVHNKVAPSIVLNHQQAREELYNTFEEYIDLPQNATLKQEGNTFQVVSSVAGEDIDMHALEESIEAHIAIQANEPISLSIHPMPARIQDSDTREAKQIAETLLREGFELVFEETTYTMRAHTLIRMIRFDEAVDVENSQDGILGVYLDDEELYNYLVRTIVPDINQEAVNARFNLVYVEGEPPRVDQFELPREGRSLDVEETASRIKDAVTHGYGSAVLAVNIQKPDVGDSADIAAHGITTLIAKGESDFAGSPQNRIHNIRVGASRYHGLLIPPDGEFSFNTQLGPVTGAAGFLPELVIKQNVTVPEFGGGLCQVSTTAFRAAVNSGLKITERRPHSYAVSYYGTPGFDSTIYPGYTDLRFLNNTPGYILIQTRIVGTRLIFEFWGTDDGREVIVDGPHPYDRRANGAVKATLDQRVIRDGDTIIEDSFFSNYQSPDLFPRAVSANNEQHEPEPTANNDESSDTPASTPGEVPEDEEV